MWSLWTLVCKGRHKFWFVEFSRFFYYWHVAASLMFGGDGFLKKYPVKIFNGKTGLSIFNKIEGIFL